MTYHCLEILKELKNRSISIVIPAHNVEAFLAEAIESALNQEGVVSEVIVVENGSTDSTLEVAKDFGDRIKLLQSGEAGAQKARNVGLAAATGHYLKFLDADDRFLPGVLTMQLDQAAREESNNPQAVVTGNITLIDVQGERMGEVLFDKRKPEEDPLLHLYFNNPLTGCPLHQTALVKKIGGMDESLPREHETDLHFRLVQAGAEFIQFPEYIYEYRQFQGGSNLMSGGIARFGSDWQLEYLLKRKKDLERHCGGSMPEKERILFGRHLWFVGREILREGDLSVANKYFAVARSLAGNKSMVGQPGYKLLASCIGPVIVECLHPRHRLLRKRLLRRQKA